MDFHSISYILLNFICVLFAISLGYSATKKESKAIKSKIRSRLIIGLGLWQLFILMVSESGFTINIDFPPRFAILFILPSFLFTGLFLYASRNKKWIKEVSIKSLTFFQSFRILVESLFLWSVAEGILAKNVTLEGYNFDMIFGFSALLIYGIVFIFKKGNKTILLMWNYIGLLVLASVIFVFISTLYFPGLYGYDQTPLKVSFLEYPYILVAAFLMPFAVFLHVLSIIRLKKGNFILE